MAHSLLGACQRHNVEENTKRVDVGHVQKHTTLKGAARDDDPQLVNGDENAFPLGHVHLEKMRI